MSIDKLVTWLIAGLWVLETAHGRKITVKNSCGVKVYAAHAGNRGQVIIGGAAAPGGWEIAKGGSTVLEVPENCERTF